MYGIFLSLGELGPGNCTIVLASKTSATAVRGQYYGVAAAVGKIGAFVGTWVFPPIIDGVYFLLALTGRVAMDLSRIRRTNYHQGEHRSLLDREW